MKSHFPDYLTGVYPFQAATSTFTIPVSIDQYDDLFNKLDHSPVPRKDLSADLVSFLQECASEIPSQYHLEIAIHLKEAALDNAQQTEVLTGIRHYFSYLTHRFQQDVRRKRLRALKYIAFSIAFITTAVLTTPWMTRGPLFEIINEGLHIGGWVFLWEAFSMNFIAMDTTQTDIQNTKRLCQAAIRFDYSSPGGAAFPTKDDYMR